MELITEYLIIIEKNASEAFYHLCDSTDGFNKLLQTDSNIVIGRGRIKYKDSFEFPYEVKGGNVEGKEQRFFQVKITFNGAEDNIDEYSEMLKSLRGIVHRSGGQLETLKDDVSFFFANQSYPLIHKVESLMRKLITYFMLTNVGKEWVIEASPVSVKEAIDKSKRKQYVDVLHQIDFIHLGDFLFKAYQTKSIAELYEVVEKAQNVADLNLDELKSFRAKSNWERYFSKVVACDDKYLGKRWTQLYELRCMIAHNAIVTKSDYERIVQLVDDVSGYLQTAIDNLDKVHVPSEDKDQIAENVASNVNALYGSFIQLWRTLEAILIKAGVELGGTLRPKAAGHMLRELYANKLITDEQYNEGIELNHFRNRLLHEASASFNEHEISTNIIRLENYIRTIRGSWKDEIVNALQAFGGKATLGEIYTYIESNTNRNLPETWHATVRYTLQIHSSDTESYKGGEDIFQRLDKGYWGLRDSKHDIS